MRLIHAREGEEEMTLDVQAGILYRHANPRHEKSVIPLDAGGIRRWQTRLLGNANSWTGVPQYADGTSPYPDEQAYVDVCLT